MNSYRPFDPDRPLFSSRCSCGRHSSDAEHALDLSAKIDEEKISADFVEASLVKALFPQESRRRAFLKAVGAGGAMSALSGFLPVGALQAMAQEKAPLEKPDLKIGISSSCLGVVPFCFPPFLLSISSTKSLLCNGNPAGHPSITIPTHAPCDSPKICTLNKVTN